MKKVAAIVVTYNRKALLLQNLSALEKQTYKDFDILVIDNASTDGTKEALSDRIASGAISWYSTGANLGGAGGFSFGVKKAVEAGYEYVWLMDDDAIPGKHALEKLMKVMEKKRKKPGFLCSQVLWKDRSVCRMNIPKANILHKVDDFLSPLVRVQMATFVSCLIPSSVVKEVGLPIADFFIWADDLEYTRRISRKYPAYLVNGSVVLHKTGNNVGSNISIDSEDRLDRYAYAYRNEVVLFRREGLLGYAYWAARLCYHILSVLKKAPSAKLKRIRIILSATREGLHFHP